MKKTLANKINKSHNGYTVELTGLNYICDGYGFYLVADLDGADPAALRPMSTEKNSAGHILAEAVRAFQYNELIPVYNLGSVTREIEKSKAHYCIMQDESKKQTAAYNLKLIGLAENNTKFDFFFFSPSGSFSAKSTFLVGVYDGIVSLVLLPVNLRDADFETLAAEAAANAAAELEAKQAKKAAAKDPAPVAPVQDKPAPTETPAEKQEKKNPADEYTPETLAAALAAPDWKATAAMLIGWNMRNTNLILLAALDADLLTPEMVLNYILRGQMPAFHTFNTWKDHGYIVKRGEKAAFKAKIWKYYTAAHEVTAEEAARAAEIMEGGPAAGDTIDTSDYTMKESYFFTADQVEKITRGSVDLPDDCKREMQDGREIITGNTRPIKEQIKAAGYMWDRKAACWWRPAEDPAA